jgi:hypothetical protein
MFGRGSFIGGGKIYVKDQFTDMKLLGKVIFLFWGNVWEGNLHGVGECR